ncbi:MAG: two-component regulator propeller domain-containing protein [Cyclobacteriaceae bacterium]
MKLPAFTLLFLLFYGFLEARRADIPLLRDSLTFTQPSDYHFKNININDGLSQNSVVDIEEDASGFMWFATQDGLNRYDGREFISFPRVFEDITTPTNVQLGKIKADGNKLWLITMGGKLESFDLYTQKFSPPAFLPMTDEPLPTLSYILPDKKKNLWMGTLNQGLLYLDQQKHEVYFYNEQQTGSKKLLSNTIRSIYEDSADRIWVITDKGINQTGENQSQAYLNGINTNVMTEDARQNLWVGSLGRGLFVKYSGEEEFRPFNGFGKNTLPDDLVVEAILADRENRIWVGTYGDGLYTIDTEKANIIHVVSDSRNPFSLGFDDVISIKQDSRGGIWIGTDGGGISYYHKQFNNFSLVSGLNVPPDISIEQIRAITTDEEGIVWLGTSGKGLTACIPSQNKYDTYHLRPFKPGISNYDRIVSLMADSAGDLWIGTQGNGLLIMNRSSKKITKWFTDEAVSLEESIPDNTIWCIQAVADNRAWVATRNAGLLLLDKEQGVLKQYVLPLKNGYADADNNLRSITEINDTTLALGYERSGIQLLHLPSGNFTSLHHVLTDNKLMQETAIKCLYYKAGWLWVGTAGKGILLIHLESGNTVKLGEQQGLPNNMIYGILPESDEAVWLSSNKGLCRIVYEQHEQNITLKSIIPYTIADGLQSNEFNTGAFYKSGEGILYFGGISGLNYFDPARIIHNQKAAPVVLTSAMIGNKPLKEDTLITYKKRLNLSYEQNSVSFNYTALDFVSPEKLQFQYLLEGYDEDWVDAKTRNYTAYTNLPPGNYTFRVRVSNPGRAEAPVSSLPISIFTPFWLRGWFIVLAFFFALALLWGIYRYRVNELLRIQMVKNSISADLHDDIGSRLTNIQFMSALSKQKIRSNKEAESFFKVIEEEVQASAEALDEIVWNINMKDESLEDITAKMRRYAGEVLESDGIQYHVEIHSGFEHKNMKMQKRRELFLIFKELLNNIRKHAGAGKVRIQVSISNDMFYLFVNDDGIGFDPLASTDRNGLRNIRGRVDKWKGIFQIQSGQNEGTLVEIWLPFDKRPFFRKFLAPVKRIFFPGFFRLHPPKR